MRQLRIDRWTALLAAIGVLGAILVLLRTTPYGVVLGVDAAKYVSTAHSLLAGDGFVMHYGDPYYREGMPGLPLALALIGLFGPDPLDAVGYLHAAAFGLTVLVVAAWVRSRTGSRFLAVWAGLACALSPLGGLFSSAMTDPLFICFAVLSLFALDRYLGGGGRSLLLAAAVCAALACATRYLGIALVASAVPLLLLAERRGVRPAVRGVANAAIFAAVALAPLGVWALYNFAMAGSSVYRFTPTGWDTSAALHRITGEFARWTLGDGGYARLRAVAGALPGEALPGADGASAAGVLLQAAVPLAAAACAAAAVAFLRRRGRGPGGLAVPAAFAAVYLPAVLFTNWYLDFNLSAQPRYLAPLYPPLLVAAAIALGGLLREALMRGPLVRLPRRLGGAEASLPALALAAALALWLPQQTLATLGDVRDWRAEGRGYAAGPEWTESATIRWLKAHPPEGRVWSNHSHAVYFAAGLRNGNRNLPGELRGAALRAAEARADGRGDRFVWFHHGFPQWYGLADLAALPDLEVEAILEDGAVLRPGAGSAAGGAPLAGALLDGARLLAASAFDLYLDEARNRLVYVSDVCAGVDAAARFFLEAYPADPAALPADRRYAGLDFLFARHGFHERGRCLAVRDLPGFGVAAVRTGQPVRGQEREAWSVRVSLAGIPAAAFDLDALRERAEPLAREPFEVYRDGGRLVYVRESCAAADVETRFFLHVRPADPADLPEHRRERGFDDLGFWFREGDYLFEDGGRCVAARPLPAYRIASIRTGQWGDEGEMWSVEASFGQ